MAFVIKVLNTFLWAWLLTECQRICDKSCSSIGLNGVTQLHEMFCLLVCVFMNTWLHSGSISFSTPERQVGSSHHLISYISIVPRIFLSTRYTHFKALLSVSIYQLKSLQQAFVLRNIDFRIKIAHKPNTFLRPSFLEGIWATSTAGRPFTCWKKHNLFSSLKATEYFVSVSSAQMALHRDQR